MLSKWVRTWDSRLFKPLLSAMANLRVTPNGLTLAALVFTIAAGFLIALDLRLAAVLLLFIGGMLDALDGELARHLSRQTEFGAFLDSICDHFGDLALTLGLIWYFLALGSRLAVFLAVLALFGSVFGSHVRSRAGMVGIETKEVGLFTRLERLLVLLAGLVFHLLVPALWVLAVFNNLSAFQRVIHAVRAARRLESVEEEPLR